MNRYELADYWEEDDFEETVSRALISCYESKVVKSKGASKRDNLNNDSLNMLRKTGLYIPSNSRLIIGCHADGKHYVDIKNDGYPLKGLLAYKRNIRKKSSGNGWESGWDDAYLMMIHFRKVKKFSSKYWKRTIPGVLYELYITGAHNSGGISGERRYVTVCKNGQISACNEFVNNIKLDAFGPAVNAAIFSEELLCQTEELASTAFQFHSDRMFCWSITAKEHVAQATIGCMKEEIKSLLYARDLPMTATGRKRPILHLVEAHKRRMKSGTDIDVTAFLRGTRTVEINGTLFRVNPPTHLMESVSNNSKKHFSNENNTFAI